MDVKSEEFIEALGYSVEKDSKCSLFRGVKVKNTKRSCLIFYIGSMGNIYVDKLKKYAWMELRTELIEADITENESTVKNVLIGEMPSIEEMKKEVEFLRKNFTEVNVEE